MANTFTDIMGYDGTHTESGETVNDSVTDAYNRGAANLWTLIQNFVSTSVAEKKMAKVLVTSAVSDLVTIYSPETLARAMESIENLRESVNFQRGDILINTNGVKITVTSADKKEGVAQNGKFYTISNVYDWQKTGDTNMGLIDALDDVDATPASEP